MSAEKYAVPQKSPSNPIEDRRREGISLEGFISQPEAVTWWRTTAIGVIAGLVTVIIDVVVGQPLVLGALFSMSSMTWPLLQSVIVLGSIGFVYGLLLLVYKSQRPVIVFLLTYCCDCLPIGDAAMVLTAPIEDRMLPPRERKFQPERREIKRKNRKTLQNNEGSSSMFPIPQAAIAVATGRVWRE